MSAPRFVSRVALSGALLVVSLCNRTALADDSPSTAAPDKLACISGDTDGQALRLKHELLAARKRFRVCSSTSCPKVVRDDCLERLAEATKAQPLVVFVATNGDGAVLRDVKVYIDDKWVTSRLTERPFEVDPGEHIFTFNALGRIQAESTVVLPEGRRESHGVVLWMRQYRDSAESSVAVAPPTKAVSVDTPPPPVTVAPAPATTVDATSLPTTGVAPEASPGLFDPSTSYGRLEILAAGVAVTGIMLGAIFGSETIATWKAAQADCMKTCDPNSRAQGEVSAAHTDGVVSTASFAAAGAALAGGILLWSMDHEAVTQRGLRVVPNVGSHRGDLAFEGRF